MSLALTAAPTVTPARPAPGARAILARDTAAVHEALHHHPVFAAVADGCLDRPAYVRLLGALARYHAMMEPACRSAADRFALPALAAVAARRRARLVQDLAHLGATAPDGLPPAPALTPHAALGALYTVQGSCLGGKVIHRQLAYLLPDGAGRSFFAGDPAEPAAWRALCLRLDEAAAAPGALPEMIAGARLAFARFAECLEA